MNDSHPSSGVQKISAQLNRLLSRILRRTDDKNDLIEQLHEAQAHSVIDADAVSMMEGVMQVADLQVRDLMIPRSQMDVIDINDSLEDIVKEVLHTAHSRFPVIDQKRDNVIGVLLAKDLLRCLVDQEKDIRGLLRPAVFVPESKRLNVMLRDFRINRSPLKMCWNRLWVILRMSTILKKMKTISWPCRSSRGASVCVP